MVFFRKKEKPQDLEDKNIPSTSALKQEKSPQASLKKETPLKVAIPPEICPYDKHMRIGKGGTWPNLLPRNAEWEDLEKAFKNHLGNYVIPNRGQRGILRRKFHAQLSDDKKTCDTATASLPQIWRDVKTAVHNDEATRETIGLSNIVPPKNIHRMQKSDPLWIGDIYSSEMVVEALGKSGQSYNPDESYLDFGCSSGSLVRILKTAYPDSSFFGVDPIESAIDWAQNNITDATFAVSNPNPPLQFEDNSFSGVTAISIWSHFADFAALEWFDEMHRIIKPGGWLFFTTHGLNTVLRGLNRKRKPSRRVRAILEGLLGSDFVFEETILQKGEIKSLLDVSWGNSYFRPDWIMKNTCDKWNILHFNQGKNQNNQDVYILQSKP
jgi:SAM-dependent methyltransferase